MKTPLPATLPFSFGLMATALLALALPSLHAASGTWTGLGNQAVGTGIWGGVANWVGSGVADGVGFTATFGNSFNNGYACTVNTNRTIGNIVYIDPGNANNFTLVKHAGNFSLTLNNGGIPAVFDVKQSGRTVTVNPITAGTGGLTKTGLGKLVLANGENTLSGPIRISAGILTLGNTLAIQNAVLDTANSIPGDAANGLAATVTPLTMGGLTGDKALASVFTTTAGGYDLLGDLTLNPGAGVSRSYSGIIVNGAPGMSFTKIGEGTQTFVGANTYTGVTAITAGTLNFSTAGSAISNVIVSKLATMGVVVASNGGQWVNTGDLNFGNNCAVVIDYTSTTPGTTVAPIKVANLGRGTGVVVRLAGESLTGLVAGQSYPLTTWTTNGPANAPGFSLALPHRVTGSLSVTGKTLSVNITANAAGPISWNNGNDAWDTVAANWLDAAGVPAPASFFDTLDSVLFGDAPGAAGNPVVTLGTALSPVAVIMKSTLRDYTLTGAGGIAGAATLTLDAANTRTLTMVPFNTYTGNTIINGGTLKLGATEVIPDGTGTGTVTVNGTLDLNAFPESINGLSGSGTVDTTGAAGLPTFTVGGNNASSTFSGVLKNTAGTLALTKIGTGRLILSGTNTNTGGSTIAGGTLQVGTGGTSGSLGAGPVANSGTLEFNRTDNVIFPDEISGTGALVSSGTGILTLSTANTYSGATTVNAGVLTLSGNRTSNCGAIMVGRDGSTATLNLQDGTFAMTGTFSVGTGSAVSTGTVNHTNGSLTLSGTQLLLGNPGAAGNASTGILAIGGTGTGNTNSTLTLTGGTFSATTFPRLATAATHGVILAAANGQWANTGNLTFANNSGTLIDYGTTAPSTSAAPVKVANFSVGTAVGLQIAVSSLASLVPGQSYPLVTWTGTGPANGSAFIPALPFRILGILTVAGNTLSLNVTGNAGPISWNAGNGNWDTSAANWLDAGSVTATYVNPLDAVVFGDAAGATGNPVITLGTALSPVSVTMKSLSHDYTIAGPGSITGPAPLTLDAANTRTLTMVPANTYTGNTVI